TLCRSHAERPAQPAPDIAREAGEEAIPAPLAVVVALQLRDEALLPESQQRRSKLRFAQVESDRRSLPRRLVGVRETDPGDRGLVARLSHPHDDPLVVESEPDVAAAGRHPFDPWRPPTGQALQRRQGGEDLLGRGVHDELSGVVGHDRAPWRAVVQSAPVIASPVSSMVLISASRRGQPWLTDSSTLLPGSNPSWITVSRTSSSTGSSSKVT